MWQFLDIVLCPHDIHINKNVLNHWPQIQYHPISSRLSEETGKCKSHNFIGLAVNFERFQQISLSVGSPTLAEYGHLHTTARTACQLCPLQTGRKNIHFKTEPLITAYLTWPCFSFWFQGVSLASRDKWHYSFLNSCNSTSNLQNVVLANSF